MTKQSEAELAKMARERLLATFRDLNLHTKLASRDAQKGLQIHGSDAPFDFVIELRSPEHTRLLLVELKRFVPYKDLGDLQEQFEHVRSAKGKPIPLLLVPHLTPGAKERLRRTNINYADLSGAISVREPGFWIEMQGSREKVVWPYASQNVNPFSDKASLILRVLLRDATQPWRLSDIARAANVTKGWVSVVTRSLLESGYIAKVEGGLRITEPSRVLRDWTAAYSWRRNHASSYYSALTKSELLDGVAHLTKTAQWALTLHAGASLVAPHVEYEQVQLYVEPSAFDQFESRARRQLYLEPVSTGGNLLLLRPYYSTSAFFDLLRIDDFPVVSPLQLYLDLLEYPVRGREAADVLLRTQLSRSLNLNPRELADLLG